MSEEDQKGFDMINGLLRDIQQEARTHKFLNDLSNTEKINNEFTNKRFPPSPKSEREADTTLSIKHIL